MAPPLAQPAGPPVVTPHWQPAPVVDYAGFWLRLVAHLLDGFIISVPAIILVVIIFLTTGASGLGPVKDFKLVIDKGKPERLVSFCFDNVKKISPTAFEVRMKDFTPERDLKILLLGKAD